MHDIRWESWLDALARDYFVAAYRPELPAAERLRAAESCRSLLKRLSGGGRSAMRYLAGELSAADTQRRNAAARALSVFADAEHIAILVSCYLDSGRQWLSPIHLVRAARRIPLAPSLARHVGEVPLRVQPSLVRALMAHDTAGARILLQRLLDGPDEALAEAALEAVADWDDHGLLRAVLLRADGTDDPPPAVLPAAIQAALHLARGGHRSALDWLEERTLDDKPELAGLAHAALATLGWPGCLIELDDHLRVADGVALAYGLEAAEHLASASLVPSLCSVVQRFATRRGPGLDDNPADHAIRVLERLTGKWVPPDLCSYDEHGSLDAVTRRRAALLYLNAWADLDPESRVRRGRPFGLSDLVEDLVSPSVRRVRVAAIQLEVRFGASSDFDMRDDLVHNLDAVRAWRAKAPGRSPAAGRYLWRGRDVQPPLLAV